MNLPTERLLFEAADRLKFIKCTSSESLLVSEKLKFELCSKEHGVSGSESNATPTESCLTELRRQFISLEQPKLPNEPSKLFATASHIMTSVMTCSFKNTGTIWPCDLEFNTNEAADFGFLSHWLQVSLFAEKSTEGTSTGNYLLIYSFPVDPFAYHVTLVSRNTIPQFNESVEDFTRMHDVYLTVHKIFREFCYPYNFGKYRQKEFKNTLAIMPVFSKDSRKRKRGATNKCIDVTKFKLNQCPVLERLKKLYTKLPKKPNESAKLIAIIHDVLKKFHGFQSTVRDEDWPGGIDYDSSIIPVYRQVYSKQESYASEGDKKDDIFIFNLVLYSNGREYYLSIEPVFGMSKRCVKKISMTLVPNYSGNVADPVTESEKITNLTNWLATIYSEFLEKTMSGSYCSLSSSGSTSRNMSGCQSRDEVASSSSSDT